LIPLGRKIWMKGVIRAKGKLKRGVSSGKSTERGGGVLLFGLERQLFLARKGGEA